jgi:hypothetical protein
MKNKLLFGLMVFISNYLHSQDFCNTEFVLNQTFSQSEINSGVTTLSNYDWCLKVYIHVVRTSGGTSGYTNNEVDQAFQTLTDGFAPYGITFSWDGGIHYIDDEYYFWPSGTDIFDQGYHEDGIDIYLIHGPYLGSGYGYDSEIGGKGSFTQSALYVAGFNDEINNFLGISHVITHEMGHVLGLWHTHHGTVNENSPSLECPELVNGSYLNRTVCGDYIDDTPADPGLRYEASFPPYPYIYRVNQSCVYSDAITDANGDSYTPSTNNYMSYTRLNCFEEFSPKQVIAMKYTIANTEHIQSTITQLCCNSIFDFSNNPSVVCPSDLPLQINVAITEAGNPVSGGTYSWFGACTPSVNASTTTWSPSNCTYSGPGQKTIFVNYVNETGCSSTGVYSFLYNDLECEILSSSTSCTPPINLLTASPSGGTSPYTYVWSGPGINTPPPGGVWPNHINATQSGTYYLSVTDATGNCQATDDILINIPDELIFDSFTLIDQPECQASSTTNNLGTATVSFSGGTGQVTRSITSTHPSYSSFYAAPLNVSPPSFNITSLIAEYNAPSTYTVTLEDAVGCTVTQNISGVQAQNEVTASSSVLDATCEGKDGEIILTFNASNGGPYTISGALSGSTSNTTFQTSKPAGFYGPIYVSNGTCNDVTSATIENTYEPNDLYDPNLTLGQGAACIGVANGSLNTNMAYATGAPNTSASPSWLYAWSDGQTTSNATNLLSGGYNVTITDNSSYSFVTGPNLHGCIISKSASVPNIGTSSWQEHTNPYNLGDNSNITSMAIDDQENVYVAGIFEGELNIQGQTATTSPNSINEFFVAAFNSCGILKWLNYSEGTSYDFDDIQITENGGRIYLANLPATGNPSTGTLILNDGFGNPVPMPSFNIENDGLGLIEFNAIVGSVNSVSHFFNNPYITLSSDLMDLEVGNKIYIAGKFNNKARVLELNTQSNSVLLVLEDANTGNIFHDLELGNNDDLYLVGQVLSQPMILNTSDVQPIGTSDAIIAFHNSTTTFVRSIKASNAGEATGLSLLDNGQMAVVGNYSGSIGSYLGGSIYAPTNSSTGFIANFAQTNTLDLEWLASLEAPGTQPNWNNNVTYAHCTDVSSNENNEVFVFGSFEGTSFELEANSMNYSTPGATGLESMWNGKFGGFTSTANMSIDWLTSASSPVATPVDIVSGLYNNYIAGDFTDHIAVGGSPLMSTQNPNAESSYIIRFGDQLNPQQGAYYKMDDSSEEMANNDFSLYPNPNSGILNLTWTAGEGTMEFTITDITGRLVYQSNKTNAELGTSSIDISNFDSGTYYISFQLEGNATVKPFIKL